MKLSCCNRH